MTSAISLADCTQALGHAEELLRKIAAIVPDLAGGGPIRVHLDLALDLPFVCADGRLLHQAVLNLVIHAVQAMPDGGTLRISGRADFVEDGTFATSASRAAGTTFTIRLPVPSDEQSQVTLKREARSVPHLRAVGTVR